MNIQARVGKRMTGALLLIATVWSVSYGAPGQKAVNAEKAAKAKTAEEAVQRLDRMVQSGAASEAAKLVREGRDLIAEAKWNQAQSRFQEVISKFSRSEYVDAALYWLAYTCKKQGKNQEADQYLSRLINGYPRSSWLQDARAMRVEIAPYVGRGETVAEEARNAENDEIKIVALQSLYQSNPDRAIQLSIDLLKPGVSTTSVRVREGALNLVGQFGARFYGDQALPLLLSLSLSEPDTRLRQRIIQSLGNREWRRVEGSEQIASTLTDMALTETTPEIAQTAVSSLITITEKEPAELRPLAIRIAREARTAQARQKALQGVSFIAEKEGASLVPEIIGIFSADEDIENRKTILTMLSMIESDSAQTFVEGKARSGEHPELRRRAVYVLGARGTERGITALSSVYDKEEDFDLKQMMLAAFSQSRHSAAVRKLIDIARKEPDIRLRTQAISFLGWRKDPEAQKFLEELVK